MFHFVTHRIWLQRVEAHLERCEQRKSSFVRNVNEARVERPEPADIVFDENLPVNVERNGKGELDPDSPEAIVERLGEEFNQPTEVILHALIIHSVLRSAPRYPCRVLNRL